MRQNADQQQLLLNPAAQEEAAISALDHIRTLLLRYRVIQKDFSSNVHEATAASDVDVLSSHLRANTVKLYSEVLEFQIRLAVYSCRNAALHYFHDVLKVDDWQKSLEQIKSTQGRGEEILQVSGAKSLSVCKSTRTS